jgi:Tol biopolymer transport system component
MKKPLMGITRTAWKETRHRVLFNVLILSLVYPAIGIGGYVSAKDGAGADTYDINPGTNGHTVDAKHPQIHSIETIIHDARNPKWSPDGKKISFMRLHGETAGTGSYEIYTVNVDGTDELCITEICPDLPQGRHKGTVSWHPNSQWLLLVVEKETYLGSDLPGPRSLAVPGIGINTDMWLMAADGSQAWRLTNVPTKISKTDPTPYSGILHPQFNHRGDKVLYTYTSSPGTDLFGDWEMRIADFHAPPIARVDHDNAKIYEPGEKKHWYESHCWTKDDSEIYFSFSPNKNQDDCTMDIGVLDLASGNYENLTDSWQQEGFAWDGQSAWDEHAYLSSDGNLLAYMSSNGFPMKLSNDAERLKWRSEWLISELWWMDPAIKTPIQATYFNDPTAPEFIGENKNIIGLVPNWNPETTAIVLQCGVRNLDPVTKKIIDVTYDLKIVWLDLDQNGLRDADETDCGDGICASDEAADSCPRDCLLGDISIIKKFAAHGSFSPDDTQIVVDRPKLDRFYDLYIIDLEGNIIQSLTDGNPLVNQRGNSWPVWHPTEDYIVFQSEEERHWKLRNKSFSDPGLGFFHNLYAMRSDGRQVWKLTDIPIKQRRLDGIPIYASINPCFNSDGSKLMWAERYEGDGTHDWGYWRIKMADFLIGPGGPELRNIKVVLDPPAYCGSYDCQYANGMAFIDDTTILVTGNLDGQHVFGMDLYIYDLASKQLTNLLNTPEYWEEGAAYANGRIVYMTNIDSEYILDFNDPDWPSQPRTREYWIMNVDGSNKRRLTYFNSAHSPEYLDLSRGRRTIVAACNFSHDGSKMTGVVGFDNGDNDTVKMTLNLGLFEFQE